MLAERQSVVAEEPRRVYEHPLFTYVNDQRLLSANGRIVHLTRRESELMHLLSTAPNAAVSYQVFFGLVTGSGFVVDSDKQNFKALIYRLRNIFLALDLDRELTRTVRGVGCMLVDESRPLHQDQIVPLRKKPVEPIYLRVRNGFTG